jgi:hypothetical protein
VCDDILAILAAQAKAVKDARTVLRTAPRVLRASDKT